MSRKNLLLTFGVAFWLSGASLIAQAVPDSCDVPVVVADYFNQSVRDLAPADFSVRVNEIATAVASTSIDAGPKRIAIVIDASRNVPADEWKFETEMAAEFVKHGRSGDRFAFSVIGAEASAVELLSSSEILERLQGLSGKTSERIYDALLAAARRLDPPQFGDAVVLFGHHEDTGSEATADDLQNLMAKNGVRFFAVSFANSLPPGFDLRKPVPKFSLSNLQLLTAETGFFFSFHPIAALNMPGQLPLFENFLSDVYTWIAEPYRLALPRPANKDLAKLEIAVNDMEARRVHREGIHYPRSLYPCPTQPGKLSDAHGERPATNEQRPQP
jgi:hypothetical protein